MSETLSPADDALVADVAAAAQQAHVLAQVPIRRHHFFHQRRQGGGLLGQQPDIQQHADGDEKKTEQHFGQLQREQGLRTQKHITLDEIGRRLAVGNFKELNIIVKGDVDGSIEALSDSSTCAPRAKVAPPPVIAKVLEAELKFALLSTLKVTSRLDEL